MSSAISISDTQLASEVAQAEKPVLLYFWADWCGPCRLVSPAIDWAAQEYSDRLKIFKLEVDPNPEAVKTYQVEGVPALRLLKGNEIIWSHEGAISKPKLQSQLESYLSSEN